MKAHARFRPNYVIKVQAISAVKWEREVGGNEWVRKGLQ